MSMIGMVRQISDGLIQRLQFNPNLIYEVISPAEDVAAIVDPHFPPLRLVIGDEDDDVEDAPGTDSDDGTGIDEGDDRNTSDEHQSDVLCLERSWHGIHYLLTGSAEGVSPPVDFLLMGGLEIGGVDLGYGPARSFTSKETRRIAEALAKIEPESLGEQFDGAAMSAQMVYPVVWHDEPEDENVEWLTEVYRELREFVAQAAKARLGLLVYLC